MRKNTKALLLVVLALVMTFSLVACGHTHTYSSEWTTTETHHYQASLCGHDVKLAEGEHQFGSPVENADGTQLVKTCRVCKYQVVETIQHTHTYASDWTADNDNHWKASTCGHNVKDQLAAHQFDAGVENADGTATVYTCSTCQYQKSVALPPHVCTFEGAWIVSTPATVLAEGEEYRECSSDKCTLRETRPIDKVAVVSIAVTTQPTKTTYYAGASFDPAGMVVTATGANDTTADVTAYVTYDKTTLALGDTTVTVTFQDKTAVVTIVVEEAPAIQTATVTQARTTVEAGATILVEGLFAGVSDEGAGYSKEFLLKDQANDNVIAVRGIPESYGNWPNVGYAKGDKVQLYVNLVELVYDSTVSNSQNKRYLEFNTELNPANVSDTIVSKNNIISYDLDNVITVTNWSQWKEVFDVNTLPMYSYIRIKGNVYLNQYKADAVSDGVALYRPHMNGAVSDLTTMKPDGVRAVGFRKNMVEANVGSAWKNYFKTAWNTSASGSKSNIEENVEIIAIYTSANGVNFQMTILEENWLRKEPVIVTISTNQDIVMEMANAYLRQGGQLEYDQYNNRRMTFATPEEATAQELGYFDCSSYVTSVFVNALGIDAIPFGLWQNTKNYTLYVKEHVGQEGFADAVAYWEAAEYTTEEEQKAILAEVKAMLQPGDILVYRHADKSKGFGKTYDEADLRGHAMLYMGNNMFSHSRGTSYNSNVTGASGMPYRNDPTKALDAANSSEHSLGTVQPLDGDEVLNISTASSQTRMLFDSGNGKRTDVIYNFCILRPLARTCETPAVTEQMQCRVSVVGLSFEKLTSAGINSGVLRGEEITYTLEITNHYDNEHKAVAFKDVMPEGVTFVSSNFGAAATGNTINGTFNVAAKQKLTLTWTVKVNDNAAIGSLLCNETTINGLMMKDITNSVVGYSQTQVNALATKAREYATSGATFTDPLDFAREVYKQALGVELFGANTAMTMLDDVVTPTQEVAKDFYYTFNKQGEYATMVAPNMYGGWDYYSGGDYSDNNLIRTPYEHNLTLGDVIVCRWYQNTRVYIYVGDGELVVIDSLTNTCQLVENGNEGWVTGSKLEANGYTFKNLTDGNYYQYHVLGTLYAYQRYVVLRPGQLAQ